MAVGELPEIFVAFMIQLYPRPLAIHSASSRTLGRRASAVISHRIALGGDLPEGLQESSSFPRYSPRVRISTNASNADIACVETVSSQREDHCEAQERALMSKRGLSAAQGVELSGGGSRQR
jgi:hypothetical protein